MRKEESGWPRKVKVGYGTDGSTRGLHPRGLVDRRVWREADLEKLDPKVHIIRIAASVGGKKRIGILDRAAQLNFHIANPGRRETTPAPVEEKTEVSEKVTGRERPAREEPVEEAKEVEAETEVEEETAAAGEEEEEEKPLRTEEEKTREDEEE
jgi:hypothetical protein